VLDVLPNRLKQTLIGWLQKPPVGIDLSQLTFAATDLWAHYREGVHTVFPQVFVVADRFHVVQNLHEVIHQVRRQVQKEATTPEERQQLKGLRYLLLKNEQKLTEKERIRLQKLAQTHPVLSQLYQLRQQLYAWYEVRTIPEFATVTLYRWLEKARALNLVPLTKFCKTIETWRTEIVNFFEHRITSGFVEGMNSKIRLLKRIAFGIPNHKHFRLRVIAFCG
jgi:transposase